MPQISGFGIDIAKQIFHGDPKGREFFGGIASPQAEDEATARDHIHHGPFFSHG